MLTTNVGHGQPVAGWGNASASAARARVPIAPPAKIAAISRRSSFGSHPACDRGGAVVTAWGRSGAESGGGVGCASGVIWRGLPPPRGDADRRGRAGPDSAPPAGGTVHQVGRWSSCDRNAGPRPSGAARGVGPSGPRRRSPTPRRRPSHVPTPPTRGRSSHRAGTVVGGVRVPPRFGSGEPHRRSVDPEVSCRSACGRGESMAVTPKENPSTAGPESAGFTPCVSCARIAPSASDPCWWSGPVSPARPSPTSWLARGSRSRSSSVRTSSASLMGTGTDAGDYVLTASPGRARYRAE